MKMQQHEIAARAADAVTSIAKKPAKQRDEYKSLCEGFPILLRNAGLLQAVVFLEAKKDHPHGALAVHLRDQFVGLGLLAEKENLSAKIALLNAAEYMTWTRMGDRIAYWHKRFSQALLKDETPKEAKDAVSG